MLRRKAAQMPGKTKKAARTGPGRLSAEDAAALPDRLLDAALELFSAQGYAGTSMEEIAKKAGASTKTLYSRYAGKGELLQGVVMRIMSRALAAHAAETSPDPGQVDPRIFLTALGRRILGGLGGEGAGLIQIAFAEARRAPELGKMYEQTLATGRANFRRALDIWNAQGLLPHLPDPERAAGLCISMISDHARIRTAMGRPLSKAEIDAHVPFAVDMFLRGCGYKFR
jgi:AcrR family transcriptional regulator